jgi:hypothetical protein
MLAFGPVLPNTISGNSEHGDLMVVRWRVDPDKPSQPSQRTAKMKITMPDQRHEHSDSRLPWKVSSRHAGLQQILEIFLTNHLPSEELDRRSLSSNKRNWLLEIQDAPILKPALESSILAVCLARLGRKHNNEAFMCEGLSMYTKGLSQLRQAVRDPRAQRDDETLATCLALIMFESNECPTRSIESCMAHYRGAMSLLFLRAPEAYTSGMAHCMFLQLRNISVSTPSLPSCSNRVVQICLMVSRSSKGCKCIRELFSLTINGVTCHSSPRKKACEICSSTFSSRCLKSIANMTIRIGRPASLRSYRDLTIL